MIFNLAFYLAALLFLNAALVSQGSARVSGATGATKPTPPTILHRLARPRHGFVPGEILVKFKAATSSKLRHKTIGNRGHQKIRDLGSKGLTQLKIAPHQRVEDAVAAYRHDPSVEYAQPNYIRHATSLPNDPLYSEQWALKNGGQTIAQKTYPDLVDPVNNPGLSGQDMAMEDAWNLNTDCRPILIAVIDTGVNYNQEDLAANMWDGGTNFPGHGANFVTTEGDANLRPLNPMDYSGHGTHVAGIIGAVGNNGLGTTGVCWTARIMAVRALDSTGSGTSAAIYAGTEFALHQGAKVLNMSFGGADNDPSEENAIKDALAAGAIVVTAAGNDGANNDEKENPFYPCGYSEANVICVAALDQKFALAPYSNFGAASVHVAAPGTNILSTWPGVVTALSDSFNTGGTLDWTPGAAAGGGWAYGQRSFSTDTGSVALDTLFYLSRWNAPGRVSVGAMAEEVYKVFSLPPSDAATLSYGVFFDAFRERDVLNIAFKAGAENPFRGGKLLGSYAGIQATTQNLSADVHLCAGATCSIGFQAVSGAAQIPVGLGLFNFTISQLTHGVDSYNIIEGTSMAAPHVAGLAALVWSYNPAYSNREVISNLENSGTPLAALSGKTTSGRAVNAAAALMHINAPSGVTAKKQ